MKVTAKSLFNLRLAGASFVFLALLVAGLILWLSNVYRADVDLTRSGRNSLSDASIELVQRLDKPLRVTAFTGDNPELRAKVDEEESQIAEKVKVIEAQAEEMFRRSMVITRPAPAVVIRSATSLALIGTRGATFLSWRA